MSKQTFLSMIDESMPMIKNNQVSKVVLSREKKNKFNFNNQKQSLFLYKAESNFPECTTFLYDFKNHGVFFGITPTSKARVATDSTNEIIHQHQHCNGRRRHFIHLKPHQRLRCHQRCCCLRSSQAPGLHDRSAGSGMAWAAACSGLVYASYASPGAVVHQGRAPRHAVM